MSYTPNSYFDNKLTNYAKLSGDTLTGKLTLVESTSGFASLNIPSGVVPLNPICGDIWSSDCGIFYKNSTTHQMDIGTDSVGPLEKTTISVSTDGATLSATSIGAIMYTGTGWTGDYKKYIVPAANTLSLTDNSVNYLVIDNSSGVPTFAITTDSTAINGSNKVLASTLWRETSAVHWISVDWGTSTANRLNNRQINVMRYERSSGLMLTESATKVINIGSGVIWYGITANSKSPVESSDANCVFYYHTSSTTWGKDIVNGWNNEYYDNGDSREILDNNDFVVNWVYRFVNGDDLPDIAIVLGDACKNINIAQNQPLPSSLPPILARMAILVGRIIVKQGVSTAQQIDSAFTQIFAGTTVNLHNNLGELQGGTIDEYYHLTNTQYSILTNISSVQALSATASITAGKVKYIGSNSSQILTLPNGSSGLEVSIRNAGSVSVTTSAYDGNTIEGESSLVLNPGESVSLTYINSDWTIF